MDKLMDSPWFLRFTALFLAIALFISIKTEEAKLNGKSIMSQEDVIRDFKVTPHYDDEILVVTGVPETVNVTIEGPTNLVKTTKMLKDFTVFVDLRTLPMGKHRVEIKHENISNKLNVQIEPAWIDVIIEEKITKTFKASPEINERIIADGYELVRMDVEPSTIEVTGAKSVIESISFVKSSVTGDTGIKKSFSQQARVRVLDKDLNKLNVKIVPEQVTVNVEIIENNKEVPIVLKPRGVPGPGVVVESLTAETSTITLFGPRKILDTIEEFSVDVNISDVQRTGMLVLDLKKPKGVSSMSYDKLNIQVEVILTDGEENPDSDNTASVGTVKFENMQVFVRGLDNKFKSLFLEPENGLLSLTITAEQEVIDLLDKSDFTLYVDAAEMTEEGETILPVTVDGPANVLWKLSDDEVTMKIELA